jgi:hypothetical protein
LAANPDGTRAFTGLTALSTDICAADPSSAANTIGMGFDAGDSAGGNWFLIRKDATTSIKLALDGTGATGAAPRNTTDVYDLILYARPNASEIYVRILNMSTAAVIYSGALSMTLPASNAFLTAQAQAGRGPTSGTATLYELLSLDLDSVVEGLCNVRHFGAQGDGVTDDLPAFNAAIRSIATATGDSTSSLTVFVPHGRYRLTSTLSVNKEIALVGVGAANGNRGSVLWFDTVSNPSMSAGILIESASSPVPPPDGFGNWTVLQDLSLIAASKAGSTTHGIQLKGVARISRCSIFHFGGNGIHIVANKYFVPPTNANGWTVSESFILSCGGHGLYTDSADVNAGICTALQVFTCGGWGIYDSSFLGNTYVGCQVADCKAGAYQSSDATAHTIFVGCYSESGQPPSRILSPTLVIGGLHGAGFTADSNSTRLLGSVMNEVFFTVQGDAVAVGNPGAKTGMMEVGSGVTGFLRYLTLNNSDDGPASLTFSYNYAAGYPGFYGFNFAGLGARDSLLLSGTKAVIDPLGLAMTVDAAAGGRGQGANKALFVDGFFINKNKMVNSPGVPKLGTFNPGDIVWNTSIGPGGGFAGWMCSKAGTAGTYHEFAPNPDRTASTAAASPTVTLDGQTNILAAGMWLNFDGNPYRITAIAPDLMTLTVSPPVTTSGTGRQIVYFGPVFMTFGEPGYFRADPSVAVLKTARPLLGDDLAADPGRRGFIARSVAGGADVTLTASEYIHEMIQLTGALTSNISLILPAVAGYKRWIWNATSGAFTLTVRTPAGTGTVVAPSRGAWVMCDGTDIKRMTADSVLT